MENAYIIEVGNAATISANVSAKVRGYYKLVGAPILLHCVNNEPIYAQALAKFGLSGGKRSQTRKRRN